MFNVKVFKVEMVSCPLTGETEELDKCRECRHNFGFRYTYGYGNTETKNVRCLYGG